MEHVVVIPSSSSSNRSPKLSEVHRNDARSEPDDGVSDDGPASEDARRETPGVGLDHVLVFTSNGLAVALRWMPGAGSFAEWGRVSLLPRLPPRRHRWSASSRRHPVHSVELVEDDCMEARVAYSFAPRHLGMIRVKWTAPECIAMTALDISGSFAGDEVKTKKKTRKNDAHHPRKKHLRFFQRKLYSCRFSQTRTLPSPFFMLFYIHLRRLDCLRQVEMSGCTWDVRGISFIPRQPRDAILDQRCGCSLAMTYSRGDATEQVNAHCI